MAHQCRSTVVLSIFSVFWSVALGEVVSKGELMAKVLPDLTVDGRAQS